MTERRIIVDEGAALDARLLYVLEELGRMHTAHEAQVAAMLKNMRDYFDERLEAALLKHTERMAQDSDVAKPYWVSGSEHIGAHWWQRFSQRFTTAVLMAGLAVLLAVSTYLAARLGVIK